jgi:glycosyltransferase involved in cell wall biosynthesis
MRELATVFGHEVALVSASTYPEDQETLDEISRFVDILFVGGPVERNETFRVGVRSIVNAIHPRSMFLPPAFVSLDNAPGFARKVGKLASDDKYDIIYVNGAMSFLLPRLSPPTICDPHDALTSYYQQAARRTVDLPTRALMSFQMVNSSLKHHFLLPYASVILVVSDRDRMRMPRSLTQYVEVIPIGVDLEYFKPRLPSLSQENGRILFFGDLSYAPNVDGLLHFITEILPLVRRSCPQVVLDVVGRNPSHLIIDATRRTGANLYANVPDVRPYIARSSVCIAPIYFGTGIKIKILEAMAMGKLVVTTPQGSDGILTNEETAMLVAKNDPEFAEYVARALTEKTWAGEVGVQARTAVFRNHNWSTLAGRLDATISRLCSSAKGNA